MKLYYFVSVFFLLVALQGSVCTRVGWSG